MWKSKKEMWTPINHNIYLSINKKNNNLNAIKSLSKLA